MHGLSLLCSVVFWGFDLGMDLFGGVVVGVVLSGLVLECLLPLGDSLDPLLSFSCALSFSFSILLCWQIPMQAIGLLSSPEKEFIFNVGPYLSSSMQASPAQKERILGIIAQE